VTVTNISQSFYLKSGGEICDGPTDSSLAEKVEAMARARETSQKSTTCDNSARNVSPRMEKIASIIVTAPRFVLTCSSTENVQF